MLHEWGFPEGFVAGRADRDALLVLSYCASITPREVHALAWKEGSARRLLAAVRRGALGGAAGEAALAVQARDARRRLHASGARMLDHTRYPARLLHLPDPPAWLFVRGSVPDARSVAVIGARKGTHYGREVATVLGRDLSDAGICVISGAAIGADGAAHQGALQGRGSTVAVLGSGIDVPYPRRNAQLIDKIAARGAVVSEYPPGTPVGKWRFPARNRIVAALAEAVVVVEGKAGSGSLITVEFAEDLGRDVFAVPGPVTNPLSVAPHQLIVSGAILVQDAGDILRHLRVHADPSRPEMITLREGERIVLDALVGTAMAFDALAIASRVAPGDLLSLLASLELRGLIRSVGGRYERTAAAASL